MDWFMLSSRLLLLWMTIASFIISPNDLNAALRQDILIDFDVYELRLESESVYTKKDTLRDQFYLDTSLANGKTNWLVFKQVAIPYFKVSQDEMSLAKWVQLSSCRRPKNDIRYYNFPPVFRKFNWMKIDETLCTKWIQLVTPWEEHGFSFLLDFYHYSYSNRTDIQPMFNMSPYHDDGTFAHLNNGLLPNVILSEIEKVRIWIGRSLDIDKSIQVVLGLTTEKSTSHELNLGTLDFNPIGKSKFYARREKEQFMDPLETVDTVSAFYQVWYNDADDVIAWVKFENNKPIYAEGWITWYNSNYLPPNKRDKKSRLIYPRQLPWIQLDKLSFLKLRHQHQVKPSFVRVRQIVVDYDPFIPRLATWQRDDSIWQIERQKAAQYQERIDAHHAMRIWRHLYLAKQNGFSDIDSYQRIYANKNPIR